MFSLFKNKKPVTTPEAQDEEIERKLKAMGLAAPRITLDDINNLVIKTQYHVFPDTAVTICALTLKNGFIVTGMSSSVSLANFNAKVGETVAYRNAKDKVWELEGYRLKQEIYEKAMDA